MMKTLSIFSGVVTMLMLACAVSAQTAESPTPAPAPTPALASVTTPLTATSSETMAETLTDPAPATPEAQTPSTPADQQPTGQATEFKLLWQRNVFSATRRAVVERPPQQTPSQVIAIPRDPAADWVIRGTMFRQDVWVAMVENIRTGESQIIAVGQTLAGRTIESITLEGVATGEGSIATPGQSLAVGGALNIPGATATTPGSGDAAISADASGNESSPANTDGLSVLERLRLRRAAESGAKP